MYYSYLVKYTKVPQPPFIQRWFFFSWKQETLCHFCERLFSIPGLLRKTVFVWSLTHEASLVNLFLRVLKDLNTCSQLLFKTYFVSRVSPMIICGLQTQADIRWQRKVTPWLLCFTSLRVNFTELDWSLEEQESILLETGIVPPLTVPKWCWRKVQGRQNLL